MTPARAAAGSSVGRPSASRAQSTGILSRRRWAWYILPRAATDGARSTMRSERPRPGAPQAMGDTPSSMERAPQAGMAEARVGEDEAHHAGVEGLLDEPGAHAEVVGAADAGDADAVDAGGGHGAEAVAPVDGGDDGRRLRHGRLGGAVEHAAPDPRRVRRQPADAVPRDAAQVGGDEAHGHGAGVGCRHAVGLEHVLDEPPRLRGGDVDAGWFVLHGGWK